MPDRKLVTLITPTWQRPKTILKHAIPSVARQTYPEIEHIIIPDGYDPELNEILRREGYTMDGYRKRLVPMGRNWSRYIDNDGMGDVPRLIGSYLAAGEYIGYLDDDNDLDARHVEKLVDLLEEDDSDIAMCPWDDWPDASKGVADANSFLHRAALLRYSAWDIRVGRSADFTTVRRWIDRGARWSYHNDWTLHLGRHHGGHGAPDTPEDE